MIDPKKELNTEELENVNGGCGSEPDAYLPSDHGPHIGQYDAEKYVNQKVYVVWDGGHKEYYWGTLKRSWEKPYGINTTHRTHLVHVDGAQHGYPTFIGVDHEFEGKDYTLFLYKNS